MAIWEHIALALITVTSGIFCTIARVLLSLVFKPFVVVAVRYALMMHRRVIRIAFFQERTRAFHLFFIARSNSLCQTFQKHSSFMVNIKATLQHLFHEL